MTYDTVITGSHIATPTGIIDKNLVLDEGKIVMLTNEIPSCDNKINADGLVSIPGIIDPHVHYGVYSPIDHGKIGITCCCNRRCDHHDENASIRRFVQKVIVTSIAC